MYRCESLVAVGWSDKDTQTTPSALRDVDSTLHEYAAYLNRHMDNKRVCVLAYVRRRGVYVQCCGRCTPSCTRLLYRVGVGLDGATPHSDH